MLPTFAVGFEVFFSPTTILKKKNFFFLEELSESPYL